MYTHIHNMHTCTQAHLPLSKIKFHALLVMLPLPNITSQVTRVLPSLCGVTEDLCNTNVSLKMLNKVAPAIKEHFGFLLAALLALFAFFMLLGKVSHRHSRKCWTVCEINNSLFSIEIVTLSAIMIFHTAQSTR